MKGETLRLKRDWLVGDRIGFGGMAGVWEVTSADQQAAAKLIPKAPGADRELLFVDVQAPNVIPTIDDGAHGDFWVVVMPRADKSLRDLLTESKGPLPLEEALDVLSDVAAALADLETQVVHRDLKPENVLLLDSSWRLADFGISRYAEATTAEQTRKFHMTPPYAAPEQWRHEHATPATDVYAFGVMAYELLVGTRPFQGPASHDYREQHLHHPAPSLAGVPSGLDALVAECLYKPPEARPRAANLVARLGAARAGGAASAGLSKLGQVNQDEVHRASAAAAEASAAQTDAEARRALQAAAADLWGRITTALADVLTEAAPAADVRRHGNGLALSLGRAKLSATVSSAVRQRWDRAAFDVVATAAIDLQADGPYGGRQHSVWYCDAQVPGGYAWFETAFMTSPLITQRRPQEPFAMDPGRDSGHALGPAMHTVQVAWPFTPLSLGELDEFIDRWASWLADAARGALQHPLSLPERNPAGSWRQS